MTHRPLHVEVWFDLICPWCWIGKRQLEQAMAQHRQLHPRRPLRVQWRSQQLLPNVPPQGLPYVEFYLDRLGSAAALAARQAQVCEAGASVGLTFNLSGIPLMPNTRAAHALIADAQAQCDAATVDALIEQLFQAHFMRGMNLDDGELLGALAECHDIEDGSAEPCLEPVATGVPLFEVNETLALSGSQSPQRLLALLLKAGECADQAA